MNSGESFLLARLFERTSHWFDRAKAALLEQIPCARGCSHCCKGVFPVTILDRAQIQQGLGSLELEKRQVIVQRALDQTRLIEQAAPALTHNPFIDQWADLDIDALVERFAHLECPALLPDGSCAVYPFRPLTCRSMGIPPAVGTMVEGACAVQTAVPLIRLPSLYREEEEQLLKEEADLLVRHMTLEATEGEEILLPYAFLADGIGKVAGDDT
ncbi:MAG: YkgJ family cysteine cluster protein [Nitrospira sp.]|nr:YkgJ family cysteine cluster protein [Nitrospira sp.]